ncbi:Cyclin-dependent kinase 11B [Chamberlinius hualienensis]
MSHSRTIQFIDENSEDGELGGDDDDDDIGRPPPAKALRKGPRTPPEPHKKRDEGTISAEEDTEDSLDIKPPQATALHVHSNRQRHRDKKDRQRGSGNSNTHKTENRVGSKDYYVPKEHVDRAHHSGERRKNPGGGSRIESSKRKLKESLSRRGGNVREGHGNEYFKEQRERSNKESLRDRLREKENEERERQERIEREKRLDRFIYAEKERERQREHQKRESEKRQTQKGADLGSNSSHRHSRSKKISPERTRLDIQRQRVEDNIKSSRLSKQINTVEMIRAGKSYDRLNNINEGMDSPYSEMEADSGEESAAEQEEGDNENEEYEDQEQEENITESEGNSGEHTGSDTESHEGGQGSGEEQYEEGEGPNDQEVDDGCEIEECHISKQLEADFQSDCEMEDDDTDSEINEELVDGNEDILDKPDIDDQPDEAYIEQSPPKSPSELVAELPPYFPAIQGCRNVEEFDCLNRIEEGTYGVVYRARHKKTNEIVALKRLKMEKEKEGFPITSLREINTLLKAQHPNIVTVREIVVGSNMDKIYIVMDYVEHDLKSLMEVMKQPFRIGEVKTLMIQLLRAVAHLHDNWILHRDLKVSNLLLSHKGILKVGDFGLAREYGSPLKNYTSVVVTLWYRAPELLLGAKEYSTPIDIWSVGCIFGELLTMKPLFPGRTEISQLTNHIFKDLGTPNDKIWPGYSELPVVKKVTFPNFPYNNLRKKLDRSFSNVGFDLLMKLLTYDPKRRFTAEDALKHEYFNETPLPIDPTMFPTWPAKSEQAHPRVAQSPKAPSGGKQFAKQLQGEDDDVTISGFHMGDPDIARRGDMFWIR